MSVSFGVEPADLRTYAARLRNSHGDVADAKAYLAAHGNFNFHEAGIIGLLAGGHRDWMADLQGMLDHLMQITETSARSLDEAAGTYEATDQRTAARIDGTRPPAARPQIFQD